LRRVVAIMLALLLTGCGQLWGGACLLPSAEALLVMQDLAAGAEGSQFKAMTPAPSRTEIPYAVDGRSYWGDLYLPGVAPAAALVVVPGAAREGKDDPRLVAFAMTLSRARFAVLVPDMQGVRELRVRPEDTLEVADAFRYVISQERLAPGGRAGMAAVSYAVGPAVLAALQPDLRDKVDAILAIGGYYDIVNVLTYVTTGQFQAPDGAWQIRPPNPYGKWVYVMSNLDQVTDPKDRQLLETLAQRRLDDPEAVIDDLVGQLGPEGQTVYAFVTARTPEEVVERFQRLPPKIQESIAGLDVSRHDLSPLSARLILVHGKGDPIIPYTESMRLAQAAPNTQLFLVNGLSHVNLGGLSISDMRLLGCALDALLAVRRP
jgi:pimeloyl-ACP methyl ester carboxylesterase